MKNIWVLRRLKNLGMDKTVLIDIYQKEMRSILEFGTPIWHSSISEHDADRIEQVQKKVFRLVLQKQYKSYEEACLNFKTQSLKNRREQLCLKFARKEVKREDSIFTKYKPTITHVTLAITIPNSLKYQKQTPKYSCDIGKYISQFPQIPNTNPQIHI